MNELSAQQRHARRWVLVSWTLLFVLVCVRQLQQGLSASAVGWALLFAVPLLACLPGLLRNQRYTCQWATLCVLPYFIVGITEGVANARLRAWALLMLGLSLLWFFSLLAFLRVTPVDRSAE
jgi:uncharacterized membrane protein